jgi:hypothetical protein
VITGAAFVPSTPMLVPAVASGAAAELDTVRDAAIDAVRRVLARGAERVVLIGAGSQMRTHETGSGSLRGFGVDVDIPLDPASPGGAALPLSLAVGAWLLGRAGWPGDRVALEIDADGSTATIASVATALGQDSRRSALLVVADGSAARSEKAPASLHPDAEAFDADVVAALASGHAHLLAELDRDRAASVSAAGWPAWHAAAVALAVAEDAPYDAEVRIAAAPYGVGYVVADWSTRD